MTQKSLGKSARFCCWVSSRFLSTLEMNGERGWTAVNLGEPRRCGAIEEWSDSRAIQVAILPFPPALLERVQRPRFTYLSLTMLTPFLQAQANQANRPSSNRWKSSTKTGLPKKSCWLTEWQSIGIWLIRHRRLYWQWGRSVLTVRRRVIEWVASFMGGGGPDPMAVVKDVESSPTFHCFIQACWHIF